MEVEVEDNLDKLLKATLKGQGLLTHPVAATAVVTQVGKPAPIALKWHQTQELDSPTSLQRAKNSRSLPWIW
jgi:hypothetical protein